MLLLEELTRDAGDDARIRAEIRGLQAMLAEPPEVLEGLGRRFTERLAVVAQACLLRQHAPNFVADAFVQTRLDPQWGRVVGTIDTRGMDVDRILERALPV